MSLSSLFSDGGYFMYLILVLGIVLYGGVVAQFVLAKKKDFSPILWGGLVTLFGLGLLATVVGMIQGMGTVPKAEAVAVAGRMSKVLAIAPIPTALATIMSLPAAVAIGIAAAKARRFALQRAEEA